MDPRPPDSRNVAEELLGAFLDSLKETGIEATAHQAEQIAAKMREMLDYTPKIGVFGKTGAGKSSLCNVLFGREVAAISDVEACTREPAEYLLRLGSDRTGLVLVDVPGVGESERRDTQYAALYAKLVPELDALIWVVKADDRAFTTEQRFFRDVVLPVLGRVPLIVAINQADKIEPVREWNVEARSPGPRQLENLATKRHVVHELFAIPYDTIVFVSAVEKYGLGPLLAAVVGALPDSKRVGVVREATKAARTKEAQASAEKGFWAEVWETARGVIAAVGSAVVESLAKRAGAALVRLFR